MMENKYFDLKIKELNLLKKEYKILDGDILVIMDTMPNMIGCRACYMQKAEATSRGFKIKEGHLINYYEKYREHCTVPKEIAINCWLCPVCQRLFKELMPEFNSMEVNNVSL